MRKPVVNSLSVKLVAAMMAAAAAALAVTFLLYLFAVRLNDQLSLARSLFSIIRSRTNEQFLVIGFALVLFVITFFLLTRRSIQRINRIIAGVRKMEQGKLETRIEVNSSDEIGYLAATINNMAGKLKQSIDEERQAEQAKRDLITSVSHDLRTPLTSIIGFQGLLMDRAHHSDEELERFAAIAHKKALRLQVLIDELFEYTKVNYSGYQLNRQNINLNELVGQIVEELYPVFDQAGMVCRTSVPGDRLMLWADGELLHRLLENLLNNAVKYGSEGVYVDVAVRSAPGAAVLTVTNYGPAIPPEALPHIFQRFYRVEQSRSRQTGGTGLGLAIAASIVQMHGGTIAADSGPNGTVFTIQLPDETAK